MRRCFEFFDTFPSETRDCVRQHFGGSKPFFRLDGEAGFPLVTLLGTDLGLNDATILHLDFLTHLFNSYHTILDTLADDTSIWTSKRSELLFVKELFLVKFIELASQVFEEDKPYFWKALAQYSTEHVEASLWDIRHHRAERQAYSAEDFIKCSHKSSPIKMVFAMVCQAAARPDLMPVCEDYVHNYALGLQLADDWIDWKLDLKMGQLTYPTTRALERVLPQGEPVQITDDLLMRMAKELYLTPLSKEVLDLAAKHLSIAIDLIEDLAPLLWRFSMKSRDSVALVVSQVIGKQCALFARLYPDKTAQIFADFAPQ